jgi:uncharacterized paraquat-inducible protein A
MIVTRAKVVTLTGLVVSSLLLLFAANCSLVRCAKEKNARQPPAGEGSGNQVESELIVANSFCVTCHYYFDEEELALDHKVRGIGCERCHGESQRHRSDENNITPPEIMYPKAKINPACMMCHPRHEIKNDRHHDLILAGAETVLDEGAPPLPSVEDRKGGASKSGSSEKYCTDCHGKTHRMNVRSVQWDKATGKLITSRQ